MIESLEELQKYVLEGADDFDDLIFKRSYMMTSPGCCEEEIEELKAALPGIPDSYTKLVEAINLNGIDVGYFEVCPASFNPEGMVANFIEGNKGEVLFWEYMQQYHLYSVATIDGYGIFVATASSPYKEGEIIIIDVDIYADKDNPEQWIHRLAQDFEQFLLIAGNLNQIKRQIKEDDSNYEEKKQEFLDCLKKLGVSEAYHQVWLSFF